VKGEAMDLDVLTHSLHRRAFEAWDDEFLPKMNAVRVASATFTLAKRKKERVIGTLIDDFMHALAKKQSRHFILMFGIEPYHSKERTHVQADLFVLPDEGTCSFDDLDLWVMEQGWIHGRVEIAQHRGGRSLGYACSKHDGDSQIQKIFCPRIGDCKKRKKGKRQYCKYQRNPNLIMM
jgi:hypothetical protein